MKFAHNGDRFSLHNPNMNRLLRFSPAHTNTQALLDHLRLADGSAMVDLPSFRSASSSSQRIRVILDWAIKLCDDIPEEEGASSSYRVVEEDTDDGGRSSTDNLVADPEAVAHRRELSIPPTARTNKRRRESLDRVEQGSDDSDVVSTDEGKGRGRYTQSNDLK